MLGASSSKLCVWSTAHKAADEDHEPLQLIERPILKKTLACTFRAAKYARRPPTADSPKLKSS